MIVTTSGKYTSHLVTQICLVSVHGSLLTGNLLSLFNDVSQGKPQAIVGDHWEPGSEICSPNTVLAIRYLLFSKAIPV